MDRIIKFRAWDIRIEMDTMDSYLRIDDNFEIVGNVFENPNLLNDEE